MTVPSRWGAPPQKPSLPQARAKEAFLSQCEVTAAELLALPSVPLWDVRPEFERMGEPGYIPGSRAVPMGVLEALALPWDTVLEASPYVALVCLSGRRSEVIATELRAAGYEHVLQLQGGVLGWQALGLSLCVPNAVEPRDWASIASLQEFRRAVSACFVAEAILLQVSRGDDEFVSPKLLVERVLAQPGALDSLRAALSTLDLLAENVRRLGHPVDRLGANMSAMRSTLERFQYQGLLG